MTPITRRSVLALATGAVVLPQMARAAGAKMVIATGVDPSFSAYYVAKEAGIFEKNGLDVTINTGPSGSAMVALLIQGQVQSAFGAEQAGILDHNLDPNVVVAAEGTALARWNGIVGKGVADIAALKGKRIGIARATGSEVFWLAVVDKFHLDRADYKIVQVESPEMVAALQRGDLDAYSSWEPWLTRGVQAVPGAKLVIDNVGIIEDRVLIYLNKGWAEKNTATTQAFIKSLIEATERINKERDAAAAEVAKFLKMDPAFARSLMEKLRYDIHLDQQTVANFEMTEQQLKTVGKLAKPLDWSTLFYPDPLKAVAPDKVNYKLP